MSNYIGISLGFRKMPLYLSNILPFAMSRNPKFDMQYLWYLNFDSRKCSALSPNVGGLFIFE